jgi:hypothetical protein
MLYGEANLTNSQSAQDEKWRATLKGPPPVDKVTIGGKLNSQAKAYQPFPEFTRLQKENAHAQGTLPVAFPILLLPVADSRLRKAKGARADACSGSSRRRRKSENG